MDVTSSSPPPTRPSPHQTPPSPSPSQTSQPSSSSSSPTSSCPLKPNIAKRISPTGIPSDIPTSIPRSTYNPPKTVIGRALGNELHTEAHKPVQLTSQRRLSKDGVGMALSDTPISTAPSSPQIRAQLQTPTSSTATTPKPRATTLDIPGLTRSKVSPDGRIPERDLGSKLIIVMVGLPARGKSYITKKLARYLNWLQHDTRIFNVGERRRIVAGTGGQDPSMMHVRARTTSSIDQQLVESVRRMSVTAVTFAASPPSLPEKADAPPPPPLSISPPAEILVNGQPVDAPGPTLLSPRESLAVDANVEPKRESIDQSAAFFDPRNREAVQLREQVALATLDELLDYILDQGGSIGILDATNSTLERRKTIMDHIRRRAGPELGVLFLESRCVDPVLLESNMRLKLSGPDYRTQDPSKALEDFRKRVALYEKSYVPLGEYEELNDMPYVQMIDVGRKIVAHQTNGFLSSQVVYYLLNFNLSPRQIWITRHGESIDNQLGRIGGDSELSENGHKYGKALAKFIDYQRQKWEAYQTQKAMTSHFPPHPGDSTPPNPSYGTQSTKLRNFCVWSSMMKRAIQTTSYFNDDDYDIKQMRMLDELYAGKMEGLTYEEIKTQYPEEYESRRKQKLQYRYPGPGGEGYLDVINRLRTVIVEVERTTDHVLLVTHRSVARVLLAYFLGLDRDHVAGLDVPLGVLYMLEPKPYGVDFKVYKYNPETEWFDYMPDFELHQARTI
ncbi:6-phosphofructo-2-kinase [Talaromyces marneffei ATCC 18224]|uniref:6-phosphofructo-2-kinase 1 n=1 Tax=Talaromyces marneffei (strain ATCC 18224 / CBS 334.59 / QM 7333) TaxID=441960 RepID=B6QIF6_TALMQ|nr:6-phosphofructo-2-kinase 1 [Talaromyces marneffei ATCC 18224]